MQILCIQATRSRWIHHVWELLIQHNICFICFHCTICHFKCIQSWCTSIYQVLFAVQYCIKLDSWLCAVCTCTVVYSSSCTFNLTDLYTTSGVKIHYLYQYRIWNLSPYCQYTVCRLTISANLDWDAQYTFLSFKWN